jgi:hypothetical protein
VLQVGHPVEAGARFAQVPDHLPRGHHKRGQQRTGAMAEVLELPLGGDTTPDRLARRVEEPWLGRLGRILPLEDLQARLLVAANPTSAVRTIVRLFSPRFRQESESN